MNKLPLSYMASMKLQAFLLLLPLAFDFKGQDDGGSLIQAFILAIVLLIFLRDFVYNNYLEDVGNIYAFYGAVVFLFFVVGTISVGLIRDVPFGNSWRTALPYFLMMLTMYFYSKMCRYLDFYSLYYILLRIGSLSVIFSGFYGFFVLGIPVDSVRFEILSPVIVPFFGVAVYGFMIGLRISFFDKINVILCLVLSVLSVTRNMILALFVMFFLACFVAIFQYKKLPKNIISNIVVFFIGLMFFVIISNYFEFSVTERWISKLFQSEEQLGYDVTTLTRLAEVENQLSQWTENSWTFLFGKGIGATFSYKSSYYDLIEMSGAFDRIMLANIDDYQGGHNVYAFIIFVGGIFFGGSLLIFLIYLFINSWDLFINSRKNYCIMGNDFLGYSALGFIGCASFLLMSIGGSPLGTRLGGAYLGVFFAFVLHSKCILKRKLFNE